MPQISIIIPVYKVEQYICDCLDSIKSQSFTDWECLLIDDGSPDKSGQICDKYAASDIRFRVFHVDNGGVSKARNIGLENISGEWVMFVDSDDTIACNTLEICIGLVKKNNLDLLQFSFTRDKNKLCTNDGKKTDVLGFEDFLNSKRLLVSVWGGLFKSSIIRNNHLFFVTQLKNAEDQLFVFNYINNAKKFQKIDKCLYWYRNNLNSAVNTSKTEDMVCGINALVDFKKSNHSWSAYIDCMSVVFLIKIINNNNIDFRLMKKMVKNANLSNIQMVRGRLPILFFLISKINSTLAILMVKFRNLFFRETHE